MQHAPKGKVNLRPLTMADAPKMAELANNKNISINLRDGFPHPYTLEHAKSFVEMCMAQDPTTIFGIVYDGEYVGNVGLTKGTDVYRKSAELGYFLGEPYWNRGIMTQAVNLATQFAFERLNVVRVFSSIFEYNIASQRVLEKCGFTREAVLKKAVFKSGQLWDEIRYAKLRE